MDAPSKNRRSLPLVLFVLGAIGIAALGARLVRAERAGAERGARERLRARASEEARSYSDHVAELEKKARSGDDGVAIETNGRFDRPAEPIAAVPLATIEGRDAEGDFFLEKAAESERANDLPRALGMLDAASAEGRDPSVRTIALVRRAALLLRASDPTADAAAKLALASMDEPTRTSSREGLLLRRLSNAEDPRLAHDLEALMGGQDDVFARAMLRDMKVDSSPRDAELSTIARLRRAKLDPPLSQSRAAFDDGEWMVAVRVDSSTVRYATLSVRASRGDKAANAPALVTSAEPERSDLLVERVAIGALLPNLFVEATESFDEMLADSNQRSLTVVLLLLLVLLAGGASLAMSARAARRERDAAAAKSEFVTRVGHDLRTPLTLIRMYAETIAQGRVGPGEETREFASIVARESERLTRLVATVLDFARVQDPKGASRRERRTVDAGALLDEIVIAHRPLLERAGMRASIVRPKESLRVEIDEDAMRGAIGNLVENALVHASEGGVLELSLRADGGDVVFAIADRGPGLPRESLPRVFERFARGENARGKGTGLGLALVREVALAHGGTAEAEIREGGGLVVTIRIPRSRAAMIVDQGNGSAPQ